MLASVWVAWAFKQSGVISVRTDVARRLGALEKFNIAALPAKTKKNKNQPLENQDHSPGAECYNLLQRVLTIKPIHEFM